jgi:LPS O-antigen subunit length determinant protein (WzzB/FepE family)
MEFKAIVMMVLIIGFVWGGFGLLLWRSMQADAKDTD